MRKQSTQALRKKILNDFAKGNPYGSLGGVKVTPNQILELLFKYGKETRI